MVKNHTFRFRITKPQFEQIKQDARALGYITIAPYLRDLALKRNSFIEEKIVETYHLTKEILEVLQNGREKNTRLDQNIK